MMRVPTTTYRMEARLAGQDPETWCRGTVSRAEVLDAFTHLVADDAAGDAPLFAPETGHRLVVLADPPTSAPVSPENAQDLPAQAWLRVGAGGRIRLGSPTSPDRARVTAQVVRASRPLGSSDWVEVREVAR